MKYTEENKKSAAAKFLGGKTIQAEQEAPATEKPKRKPAAKKTEAPAEPEKKKIKGKGLTVWMDPEAIEELTRYAGATGKKKGEIISAALADYMKKHPATAEQKKAYNDKQKKQMFNV